MQTSLQKTILKPNQRFETSSMASLVRAIRTLVSRKDMIYQLVRKEFFAVYKKSFIGSLWIVIAPLAGILSWVFLHRTHIITPGDVGVPYPAYILVGTTIWGLFVSMTTAFMNAMSNYRHLLLWTSFPHEAVFGTQFILRLVDFTIAFIVTMLSLVIFRIIPSLGIVYLPLILIPLLLMAAAVGITVSVLSVVSYDIRRVVTGVLGLLMFVTPVIYSAHAVTNLWLKNLILANPLTYLVCSARDCVFFGRLYDVRGFVICTLVSVVMFFVSWRIFHVAEDKIIERMI